MTINTAIQVKHSNFLQLGRPRFHRNRIPTWIPSQPPTFLEEEERLRDIIAAHRNITEIALPTSRLKSLCVTTCTLLPRCHGHVWRIDLWKLTFFRRPDDLYAFYPSWKSDNSSKHNTKLKTQTSHSRRFLKTGNDGKPKVTSGGIISKVEAT